MDKIDKSLLNILENDARISFAALSEHAGLSKTPCWNRIKELETNRSILGYRAQLDPVALGLTIHGLVHVVVNFDEYEAFEAAILAHPQVRACHAVTGDFDYMLEILATDMQAFDQLLRADLSRLPGVARFTTSLSTRRVKMDSPYTDMLP